MKEDWLPPYCDLMKRCWATKGKERPSFTEIYDQLMKIALNFSEGDLKITRKGHLGRRTILPFLSDENDELRKLVDCSIRGRGYPVDKFESLEVP